MVGVWAEVNQRVAILGPESQQTNVTKKIIFLLL